MDKTELRQFRAALVEADKVLKSDDQFYVPGLHGSGEEVVINQAMFDHVATTFTGKRDGY